MLAAMAYFESYQATLALLPHDSVWCISTMALSRLMLSMDGISQARSQHDEDETPRGATRPPSVTTVTLEFGQNIERKLESVRRALVNTPQSRSHTPMSVVETMNMDTGTPIAISSGRSLSTLSALKERRSQVLLEDIVPNQQAAWYPGAIAEEMALQGTDMTPRSSLGSTSLSVNTPNPMLCVRSLPPIPQRAARRFPVDMLTGGLVGVFKTRQQSLSLVSPIQGLKKTHRPPAPSISMDSSQSYPLAEVNTPRFYSSTQSVQRGRVAPGPSQTLHGNNEPGEVVLPETHGFQRFGTKRPSIAAFGAEPQPWVDKWPNVASRTLQ